MTFKNPSHRSHYSSLERPSFNGPEQEETLQEKQTDPESVTSEVEKEPVLLKDTAEKDEARIGEIKKQINDRVHTHDAFDSIRANIKRIRVEKMENAKNRSKSGTVVSPKKDGLWGNIKSFFGGKSE